MFSLSVQNKQRVTLSTLPHLGETFPANSVEVSFVVLLLSHAVLLFHHLLIFILLYCLFPPGTWPRLCSWKNILASNPASYACLLVLERLHKWSREQIKTRPRKLKHKTNELLFLVLEGVSPLFWKASSVLTDWRETQVYKLQYLQAC